MPASAQLTLNLHLGFLAGVGTGAALALSLICLRPGGFSAHQLTRYISGKASVTTEGKCHGQTGSRPTASTSGEVDGGEDSGVEAREAFWFEENLTPVFSVKLGLLAITFEARSAFQRVQVIETAQFGRTLVMDGQTQSAEADEHIYHESLVHPAMLLHPNPKRVYIGGGGEFATAREVLRHASVEKCIMVDIDKVACDICREQLPEWNGGAYEDPRFEVHYTDAKQWLEDRPEEKFDVIVLDICDPIEAGPAYKLYTQEFYQFLKSRLNDNGVVVTQSGPGAVYNAKEECFTVIHNTIKSVFPNVVPYTTDVPSFGCNWGFNMAIVNQQEALEAEAATNVLEMPIKDIDQRIKERIQTELKFLDGVSFKGLVGIPKNIREACLEETRVMTVDNPVFMYAK